MLDLLRGRDERGIHHVRRGVFFHQVLPFGNQAFHRFAFVSARRFAKRLEDCLESIDMSLSLREMLFKAGREFLVRGRFRHLWQRLGKLFFGAVDILQFVHVKIPE